MPVHFKANVSPAISDTNIIVTVNVYTLPPHNWVVTLSNSDDFARALLNGKEVLNCGFAKTCSLTLNGLLKRGVTNQLVVETVNTGGGYTYGWSLTADGQRKAGKSCGTAGRIGCNNNATAPPGVIFRASYPIRFW